MDRVDTLEEKLMHQERIIEDLSAALIEKEKRITRLEESLSRLEQALRIVAQRGGGGEVAGAHPEEDPVPRSG